MTKRRIVLDGDIDNPAHEAMSLLARLLWDRLWKTCDFWGRERWRSDVLKIVCFPEDKKVKVKDIDGAMKELEGQSDLLGIYSGGERQFYQLKDWEKAFKGEHRGDSSIPEPPKGWGQQMKLATQRQSTEKPTETPIAGLGTGTGTVLVGAESPSGKKEVESLTKLAKKEMKQVLEADMALPYAELRKLSAERQAAVAREKKRRSEGEAEEHEQEILSDEQICERLVWTPEELEVKRKLGISSWMGVRLL